MLRGVIKYAEGRQNLTLHKDWTFPNHIPSEERLSTNFNPHGYSFGVIAYVVVTPLKPLVDRSLYCIGM